MIGAVSTMVGCGGSSADKRSTSEVESVISDQNNGGTSVKVQAQNTTQENPNQKTVDGINKAMILYYQSLKPQLTNYIISILKNKLSSEDKAKLEAGSEVAAEINSRLETEAAAEADEMIKHMIQKWQSKPTAN